jgi:hypothetical protein
MTEDSGAKSWRIRLPREVRGYWERWRMVIVITSFIVKQREE